MEKFSTGINIPGSATLINIHLTCVSQAPNPEAAVTAGRGEELLPRVKAEAEHRPLVALQHSVRVGRRVRHLHRDNFKFKNDFPFFSLYVRYFER
jgi:hypothetical protein